VTDAGAAGAEPAPPHEVITLPARWVISATAHSCVVKAAPTIYPRDRIGIWVDGNGRQVDEPTALSRAANDAAVAALVIWVIVLAAGAGLLAIARAMLNRVRNTGWQRDIDNLLCHGGGQTDLHPTLAWFTRLTNAFSK
jgi:hypothetical protein